MAGYLKEGPTSAAGVPELLARASSVLMRELARLPAPTIMPGAPNLSRAALEGSGNANELSNISAPPCPVTGSSLPLTGSDPEGLRRQAHELVAGLFGALGQGPAMGAAKQGGPHRNVAHSDNVYDLSGHVCPVTKAAVPWTFDKDQLRRQAHEFIETLLITFRAATGEESIPAEDKVPVVRCLAPTPAGSDARASLTIANEESTSSEVVLYCTNFVADSGYEIPSLRVSVTPRHQTIPPKGKATFDITIAISQQTPAGTYSGLIQAMGSKYVKAVLSVEVR